MSVTTSPSSKKGQRRPSRVTVRRGTSFVTLDVVPLGADDERTPWGWKVVCPQMVEVSLGRVVAKVQHWHYCMNGPENTRPDFHVCVCGASFVKRMKDVESH